VGTDGKILPSLHSLSKMNLVIMPLHGIIAQND